MKKILEKLLRLLARLVVKKYRPRIIGVAGSVGKTSAKEAIYAVVSSHRVTGKSIKNYNNEIGVPLSIMGAYSGGSSVIGWCRVLCRALWLLVRTDRTYPDTLVLEYGVDRVGDMAYLHTIARPDIGVLTAVAEEHLEYLGSLEGVFAEERQIIARLPHDGTAIINFDDGYARGLIESSRARVISYGMGEGAHVRAESVHVAGLEQPYCSTQYEWECVEWGMRFTVTYQASVVPIFLPHVAGVQHVYAALAAIAAGLATGMNLVEIADALQSYEPAPGRMRLLMGVKHTLVIDDTYNSSPRAAQAALRLLADVPLQHPAARRWAVLGDMRELGDASPDAHRAAGMLVAELGIADLVTVGPESRLTAAAAIEAGLDASRVVSFDTAQQAGAHVQQRMQTGDILLVKGSQGIRLEKVVQEIMADPSRASELLARQGREWERGD